ncbi:MAG: GNAT family N-acetyltransferase [Caldilineae bacterium]|nr:MAG: GNAT family N-acetyltransferase [Caldilineae bacterium]
MPAPHATLNLPRDLGDGLRMRLATPADTGAVAEFCSRVHLEADEPDDILDAWVRDLMSGRHPTTSAADFVLVEDTAAAGKIVAVTCLIPQVWRYDDIPFPVGRPELVGTDPAYRRRGLIRAVMEAIHRLSAAYGHVAQGITGIYWFYRQFDYEYALPLGGGYLLSAHHIPPLKEGESEPYRLRPATEADIPTLTRLYDRLCAGNLVVARPDEARWRYALRHCNPHSAEALSHFCILDAGGRVVGFCATPARLWESALRVYMLSVEEGVSLHAVMPSLLRALKKQGEAQLAAMRAQKPDAPAALTGIRFSLGATHPARTLLKTRPGVERRPYAWYMRVPDLPAFLRLIAPVLERRLANSVLCGYTGDLKLTFYRRDWRLVFEGGALAAIEPWQAPPTNEEWTGAGFPPHTFLQLLFGYRSLDELRHAHADCWASDEPALLLDILFPKQPSWVQPMG